MRTLKIRKLCVDICVGESGDRLTRAAKVLEQLTGQEPVFSKGSMLFFSIFLFYPNLCQQSFKLNKITAFRLTIFLNLNWSDCVTSLEDQLRNRRLISILLEFLNSAVFVGFCYFLVGLFEWHRFLLAVAFIRELIFMSGLRKRTYSQIKYPSFNADKSKYSIFVINLKL